MGIGSQQDHLAKFGPSVLPARGLEFFAVACSCLSVIVVATSVRASSSCFFHLFFV